MDRSIHPYFLDRLFFCSPSHCIIESEIDNGRAKISGYGFLGIAGFFDRLFPWMGGSFQPRSSQLHREEKFNRPRLFILTLGVTVQIFIRTNLSLHGLSSPVISASIYREQIRSQFRSHLRIYFLARTSQVRYLHPRCKKRVDIVIGISVYRFKRIYIYCRYFSKFIPNTIN